MRTTCTEWLSGFSDPFPANTTGVASAGEDRPTTPPSARAVSAGRKSALRKRRAPLERPFFPGFVLGGVVLDIAGVRLTELRPTQTFDCRPEAPGPRWRS